MTKRRKSILYSSDIRFALCLLSLSLFLAGGGSGWYPRTNTYPSRLWVSPPRHVCSASSGHRKKCQRTERFRHGRGRRGHHGIACGSCQAFVGLVWGFRRRWQGGDEGWCVPPLEDRVIWIERVISRTLTEPTGSECVAGSQGGLNPVEITHFNPSGNPFSFPRSFFQFT